MRNKINCFLGVLLFCVLVLNAQKVDVKSSLYSIETDYTIQKVRVAKDKSKDYIVGTSYEGTVIGLSYNGKQLWEHKLSGFMNHDVWCGDLDNDGKDEIVTANADGTVYCLNSKGKLLWRFKKNSAPMYAVNIIKKGAKSYVVAGGFDKSIYYLSPKGVLVKEIKSSTFSIEKPWSKSKKLLPKPAIATANFIRTVKQKNGDDVLAVLATNNHMNVPGTLYFFKPLEDLPFKKVPVKGNKALKKKIRIRPIGDFKLIDVDNDGADEIVLGASAHSNDLLISTYDLEENKFSFHKINKVRFGYDIAQTVLLKNKKENLYLTRIGNQMRIYNPLENNSKEEIIQGKYAYNDVFKDEKNEKVLLASSQSGGSCIHVLNLKNDQWKKAYKKLSPKGKIATILKNTKNTRDLLDSYQKPTTEHISQPVYLMTEKVPDNLLGLKNKLERKYQSPVFLNSIHMRNVEKFDRSVLTNKKYQKSRDRRKKYTLSSQEAVDQITAQYNGAPGVAYWGGHGNDPYMFSINTTKKIIDKAENKKTVLIYPEVEDHNEDNLNFLLNDLIYPLAKHAQGRNANIFLRSKNVFWLGSNYLSPWSRLMSGEFADVFVPSMEETTDKTMELSLAGRMGMWASGAVNSWGTRAVPDNVSIDRARQLGNQRLPNHMLRMLIFHTANGAQFINNFAVDQDYMSIYWELIAKGALYVPKRNEVLSISPVHMSMKEPDHHYLNDGANVKWTVFYDEEFEKKNPFVLSRMNGTWPGAPVTEWDFSRYAAGVKERRLNFLAPYENGVVLITPPQQGVFAKGDVPRGLLKNNLHPIYKNIMKEYITDGHKYYSNDGTKTYNADEYYKVIESDIKESSKKLPITVSGDVAWVVSQIAPKKLRLTLIDNGYINPEKSSALVRFNTIKPTQVKDVLSGEQFKVSDTVSKIEIPLGGFRFIDVLLKEAL
ncbi:hypothetical protein [Wenyingzhuangia sp. IMCC45574]